MADTDKNKKNQPASASSDESTSSATHNFVDDEQAVDLLALDQTIAKTNMSDISTPKRKLRKRKPAPKTASEGSKEIAANQPAPARKPNVNIKSDDHMLAGIEDITAYIKQRKQVGQTPETSSPTATAALAAQDGTELLSLPWIYAVVPHTKGDHKLVYLSGNAPAGLLDDPRQRVKGGAYEKKGLKIYEVKLAMKEHPTLKSSGGENMDVRLIDSPIELTQQLTAIAKGKGGGDNFGEPIVVASTASAVAGIEEASVQQQVVPIPEPSLPPSPAPEEQTEQPTEMGDQTPPEELPPVHEAPQELPSEVFSEVEQEGQSVLPEGTIAEPIISADAGSHMFAVQDETLLPSAESTPSEESGELPSEAPVETMTDATAGSFFSPSTTDPISETSAPEEASSAELFATPAEEPQTQAPELPEVDLSTLSWETEPSVPSSSLEPVSQETLPEQEPLPEAPVQDAAAFLGVSPLEELPQAPDVSDGTNETNETTGIMFDTAEPTQDTSQASSPEAQTSSSFLHAPESALSSTASDAPSSGEGFWGGDAKPTTPLEEPVTQEQSVSERLTTSTSPQASQEPIQAPATNPNVLNLDEMTIEEAPPTSSWSSDTAALTSDTPPPPKKQSMKLLGRVIRGGLLVLIVVIFILIRKVMFPPIKGIKQPTEPGLIPIVTEVNETGATTPTGVTTVPLAPQATGGSYTIPELRAKLEAQQTEARRLANTAKLLDNKEAIKFSLTALLKAGNILERIANESTISADEIIQESDKIDLYIQKAQEIVE